MMHLRDGVTPTQPSQHKKTSSPAHKFESHLTRLVHIIAARLGLHMFTSPSTLLEKHKSSNLPKVTSDKQNYQKLQP
ncbi:hypothetical protein HBI41_085710 [Parastagonospora nodorum]|nr:hypothetical protein HBI41_085710 [Parastagonospora nodorum]